MLVQQADISIVMDILFVVAVLWIRLSMIWDNMISKKKFSGHQELPYLLRAMLGKKRKD
ncbi:hypothetical protein D3C87_1873490 [compost metagenome]